MPDEIAVKQHLAFDEIHSKVLGVIEAANCDVVIMTFAEPDSAREFLVGSNADTFRRRSLVSVLAIRA